MNDDSVSRQAVIDTLLLGKEILSRVLDDMDVVGADREKYSWGLGLIESIIKDIEELPSAQRWIPCEERLPEKEKAYLVTFACEKVGMSSWHKDTFNRGFNRGFDAYLTGVTEDGECEYFGVVAWMENPEPWKGEE